VNQPCRVRFRVRIAKPLNTADLVRIVNIFGREVRVSSELKSQPLSKTVWLVFEAQGFPDKQEASKFAQILPTVVELASLCTRNGIDVGENCATSRMNEGFARSMNLLEPHERLLPNIHGVMIIPDDNASRFPFGEVQGDSLADPEYFLGAVAEGGSEPEVGSAELRNAIHLLNLGLINPDPIGQIALALSAVEALGQSERWAEAQISLLEQLAISAGESSSCSDEEGAEVAEALRRSLHRIGLRQGVLRILRKLEISHLRNEWDRVYKLRSGIFHGTRPLSRDEVIQLAHDAISLCGAIVLALAKSEGVRVPSIAALNFPL